jgi:cardiolipin synthase (CMP-forming)
MKSLMTIPNAITVVRLALLPVYVSLMADDRVVAGSFFFGALGFTDWIDGYIARRFNQVSEFGKIIDPVADRLVFFVGIGTAMYYNHFPLWFGIIILIREVSIALVMVLGTLMGMERFAVTRLGKWATFALLCAVPWITIGSAGGVWVAIEVVGWMVGIPGIVVSYIAFFQYLPTVRANMSRNP